MRRQPRGSSLLRLGAPPSRQANARSCGKRSTPVKLLWNRSLDGAPLRGALLDGAPLRGALLDGAPLRGALLDGAPLRGALLDGAPLRGALLDGAPLRGALLDGAPLRGALLRAVLLGVTFLTASLCGAGTRAAGASAICNSADLMDVVNRPNTAWSPCVVGPDGVLIESGYYQNASSVGGSTVAEYPSAELRFGFAHDIEAVLDTPSQIAASGNQGRGTFSESSPGVGFKWQLANGPNSAYGLGAEI